MSPIQVTRSFVLRLVTALALVGLVMGCSSGPRPADGPSDSAVSESRVVFADGSLSGDIEVEQVHANRNGDNRLKIDAAIRNISGEDVQLMVQAQFYDATGVPYGDETTRQVFLIPRGATKWFSATSMQPKAGDYKILLWWRES